MINIYNFSTVVAAIFIVSLDSRACHTDGELVPTNGEEDSHLYSPTFNAIIISFFIYNIIDAYQPNLRHQSTGDQEGLIQQKNAKIILIDLCDNYLLILPQLMGCVVCQCAHQMGISSRYQHFITRKRQLKTLKRMLKNQKIELHEVWYYLEHTMAPFNGDYGKNFYRQCELILEGLEVS